MIQGSKTPLQRGLHSLCNRISLPSSRLYYCVFNFFKYSVSVIILYFSVSFLTAVCFIWLKVLFGYHCILELHLVQVGCSTVIIKQISKWSAVKGMGPCALNKILCFNRTFPIRGFQIYDGPIHLTRCTFKKYVPTPDRYTSAIGFLMKNSWQITPRNNISLVKFGPHVSIFLWFLHSDNGGKSRDGTFPKTESQTKDSYWVFMGGRRNSIQEQPLIACTVSRRFQGEIRSPLWHGVFLIFKWYLQRENDLFKSDDMGMGMVKFHRNRKTGFWEIQYNHEEVWVLPGILLVWGIRGWKIGKGEEYWGVWNELVLL